MEILRFIARRGATFARFSSPSPCHPCRASARYPVRFGLLQDDCRLRNVTSRMDWNTPLIRRLRDHLLDVAPSSLIPPPVEPVEDSVATPEELAIIHRFRPFAELFYLIASADGHIDADERHVMRGAFESLTGGRVRPDRLLTLEAELIEAAAGRDRDELLEDVCSALARDREDAELAFTLGVVVALADRQVDRNEQSLVDQLASWMGISTRRAHELLETGERSRRPASY